MTDESPHINALDPKTARRRIWGWWAFDWASQPYNTLLLTFVFAPYIVDLLSDGARAQAVWGYGVGAAGLIIAFSAPFLGAIADQSGRRMPFVWLFSAMYVIGAGGLWWAAPDQFNLWLTLVLFAIGLIGMEFATIFTNAMMPSLGSRQDMGRISGTGWALGYLGGLILLVITLFFFAESGQTGLTLLGREPIFGLDPGLREGTRAVGPLTALWYVVFMIPFFLWMRDDPPPTGRVPMRKAAVRAWPELKASLARLPKDRSLFAYLGASMFYRDALNGMYVFGGIYAQGVLDWSVTDTGIFGILAVSTGVLFSWIGGHFDSQKGPKPVIVINLVVLALVATCIVFVGRDSVFGMSVSPESRLPDIMFYGLGALIGAAGGALQSASRTMMVRQARPGQMTEAFGLYALAGKATSFMAPLLIGVVTDLTNSQSLGIVPLIMLFIIGFGLMWWVTPNGNGK